MKQSIVLTKQLRKAAEKKKLNQKQIANLAFFAHTTTNGHFNGYPVPAESAMSYNELFNDSELAFHLGQEFLGLIGLATGCKVKMDPLALVALIGREESQRERLEADKEIACLMATPIEGWTNEQKEDLWQYLNEYLDELLFENSLICKQLELINMSFMNLVEERIPYWKSQGWIE